MKVLLPSLVRDDVEETAKENNIYLIYIYINTHIHREVLMPVYIHLYLYSLDRSVVLPISHLIQPRHIPR